MKLDISAIRKRAEAATPGPWRECGRDRGGCVCGMVWTVAHDFPVSVALSDRDEGYTAGDGVRAGSELHKANKVFIAAARTDIPALCDRVEELEAALLWLADACDDDGDSPGANVSEAVSHARNTLADATVAADPAPGASNGTKGDPCP